MADVAQSVLIVLGRRKLVGRLSNLTLKPFFPQTSISSFRQETIKRVKVQNNGLEGSGCGTVGRAGAFNTRDPRLESSHWQFLFSVNRIEMTKIREKVA